MKKEKRDFDNFLLSFVKEHKGYGKNKQKDMKQEFISLFYKEYGVPLTNEEISSFWDKIKQKEKAEFEREQKKVGRCTGIIPIPLELYK